MTTKPSSNPLIQEVAELAFRDGASNPEYVATQILQLIKGKLPKEQDWSDDTKTAEDIRDNIVPHYRLQRYAGLLKSHERRAWRDNGYILGYNTAIKEIRELLGDGTK